MESKGKAQEGEKPWEWKMGRESKADMGLLSCTVFPCSCSWGFHHGTTVTAMMTSDDPEHQLQNPMWLMRFTILLKICALIRF